MKLYYLIFILAFLTVTGCTMSQATDKKLVIAHRGASGYLPEHSLASKAMAYAMGADYIEQDVVMTRDDHLVVLHDPYLDRVTNVMTAFPDRSRVVLGQRRWLAIDFTLEEIKSLKMSEAFSVVKDGLVEEVLADKADAQPNQQIASNYPDRFPLFSSSFQVSTLQEEIELIQGLNKSTGNNIGIYVEIKSPWFHLAAGKDISKATLQVVKSYGYQTKQDKIFIQCFDPDETRRINDQLMPELGIDLKLIQLIAETSWNETLRLSDNSPEAEWQAYNYDWMFEPGAMEKIAVYADGIGPWKSMLISEQSTAHNLIINNMVKEAQAAGMLVHPYTFRADKGRIPPYADDFEDLLDIFYFSVGVDGLFTDFPDRAVKFLQSKKSK